MHNLVILDYKFLRPIRRGIKMLVLSRIFPCINLSQLQMYMKTKKSSIQFGSGKEIILQNG